MNPVTKTFTHDHVVRDPAGKPVGRAILLNDRTYVEGAPVPVAVLLVPVTATRNIRSFVFYIDGIAYRIPQDTPQGRILLSEGMHKVNHVVLQQVNQ
jgi:hypothetical protein